MATKPPTRKSMANPHLQAPKNHRATHPALQASPRRIHRRGGGAQRGRQAPFGPGQALENDLGENGESMGKP